MTKQEDNKTAGTPGLPCPVCGGFIPVSITELLTAQGLKCPSCGLPLEIDRAASEKALGALAKLDNAQRQVNQTKQFNR